MRITAAEIKKLWKNKIFYILVFLTVAANLLLVVNNIVNTKTKVPPSAYRIFSAETADMKVQEKKQYIDEKKEMIEAIFLIDYASRVYEKNPRQAEIIKQDNIELFEKYAGYYVNESYLHYTDTLTKERLFINTIENEFYQVYGYNIYLDDIKQKAQYASIFAGISGNKSDYNTLNTLKTAQGYADMYSVNPQYQPQKSLVTTLNFVYSDIMLVLCVFLISFLIIWQEKNNGMLRIVLSTQNGRKKTGAAKVITLAVSVLFAVVAIYGANLLTCVLFYGKLSLFADIQSYVFLIGSTLKINLLTYLALYLALKWLAALLIGLVFMLCMLLAKSLFGGIAVSAVISAVCYALRQAIVPTSQYNALKYLNPVSFINTNDFLVLYRNVNLFGKPINLLNAALIFAVSVILLLGAAFVICFYKAQGVSCTKIRLPHLFAPKAKKTKAVHLFWQENKKLMFTCGAVFIIAVVALFAGYRFAQRDTETSLSEAYYAYYMQNISGKIDADKKAFLEKENEVFEPIYAAQLALRNNIISNEEYEDFLASNALLYMKYVAFNKTMQNVRRQLDVGGGYAVYDTGYRELWCMDELNPLNTLITVALCVLTTVFYSCIENTSKMHGILRSTPMGRKRLAKIKEQQLLICAALVTVAVNVFDFIFIGIKYGYKGLFLPAKAIYELNFMPAWISLFAVTAVIIGFKFLLAATACFAVYGAAVLLKSPLYTTTAVMLVLGVPAAVCSMGIGWIKWLSFIPLDNAGYYLINMRFALPLYSVAAGLIIILSAKLARSEMDG